MRLPLAWILLIIRYLPTVLRLVPAVIALVHEVEKAIRAGAAPRSVLDHALGEVSKGDWGPLARFHRDCRIENAK